MLAIKLLHLRNGCVELPLVAVSISQVVPDRRLIRRNPLGFAIFRHSLRKIPFLVPD